MGLVETGVGLVPAGGGCKEVLWRWSQTEEAKKDPDYAPLKVFNIIGTCNNSNLDCGSRTIKVYKTRG